MGNSQLLCLCSLKCEYVGEARTTLMYLFIKIIGQFSHLKLNSHSQKRKSEDLNGDSTNGQNEDKKEDDNIEEVGCFVGSC